MIDAITENIDIWTSAQTQKSKGRGRSVDNQSQYGVDKLRELILDLAVRGKLVPQDPNDEPASVLLEMNKTKNTLFDNDDTQFLMELPKGWVKCYIPQILKDEKYSIKRGPFGSSIKKDCFVDSGFKVYEQQHAINDDFSLGHYYINRKKFEELIAFEVKPNDIIISCSGTVGKVAIAPHQMEPGVINQALLKLSLDEEKLLNNYFKILFPSYYMKTETLSDLQGTAQKNMVSVATLKSEPFPLPPLAEQHRIVAKVDELMALCDQLEQEQSDNNKAHETLVNTLLNILTNAQDQSEFEDAWNRISQNFDLLFITEQSIDQLKQTILQLAVMGKLVPQNPDDEPASILLEKIAKEKAKLIKEGKIKVQKPLPDITEEEKPFPLPSGWDWAKLGDLSSNIHYGYTASADPEIKKVRLLRITDIQNDSVNWETVPGCTIPEGQTKDYELENGDILIARTGGTIGKSYLVSKLNVRSVFASYLIRVKRMTHSYPDFIKTYLGSQLYWNQLYSSTMGTGQPNVNGNALKNLIVALPPSAEQKRIVEKVDELFSICDNFKQQIVDSEETKVQLADAVVKQAVN